MELTLSGRVVAVTSGDHPHPEGGFAPARSAPTIVVGLALDAGFTIVQMPSPSGEVLPVGATVDVIIRVTDHHTARSTPQ